MAFLSREGANLYIFFQSTTTQSSESTEKCLHLHSVIKFGEENVVLY